MNNRVLIQCLLAVAVLTLSLCGCGEQKTDVKAPGMPSVDVNRYGGSSTAPATAPK